MTGILLIFTFGCIFILGFWLMEQVDHFLDSPDHTQQDDSPREPAPENPPHPFAEIFHAITHHAS